MRIGFIGLGMMGSHMVANLQKAGHELVVYDVRRAAGEAALSRGARWAETPADAARQSEIVMTSLPGPERGGAGRRWAKTGSFTARSPASFYVDLSTSSPTLIRRIHQVLGERGVQGRRRAGQRRRGRRRGSLAADHGRLRSRRLRAASSPRCCGIGDKITYIGEVGAGEVAKLVHNQIALVGPAGRRRGTHAGHQGRHRSPRSCSRRFAAAPTAAAAAASGQSMEKIILQGGWDTPRFALALARKDLGLATDLASEFGVPMPLAAVAEQALIECMNRGWGGKDMTAAWALQEDRAGVTVRGTVSV